MTRLLHTAGFAALAACAATLSLAADKVVETRDVSSFTSIALAAPIRVELTLGERDSVVLEGKADQLAMIETTVDGGSLKIRRKKDAATWNWSWGWNENHDVRARVTARSIEALGIAGSGDIHAPELHGASLKLNVAGSGDIVIGGGKVADLSVSIAGSGDVKGGKLEAQRVKVSVSGSGDATVWARETLSVSVVGSGDVSYFGDPTVSRSVVGSGDIKRIALAPH
jgi:hypothetical protein